MCIWPGLVLFALSAAWAMPGAAQTFATQTEAAVEYAQVRFIDQYDAYTIETYESDPRSWSCAVGADCGATPHASRVDLQVEGSAGRLLAESTVRGTDLGASASGRLTGPSFGRGGGHDAVVRASSQWSDVWLVAADAGRPLGSAGSMELTFTMEGRVTRLWVDDDNSTEFFPGDATVTLSGRFEGGEGDVSTWSSSLSSAAWSHGHGSGSQTVQVPFRYGVPTAVTFSLAVVTARVQRGGGDLFWASSEASFLDTARLTQIVLPGAASFSSAARSLGLATYSVAAVPEPGTLLLSTLGLMLVAGVARARDLAGSTARSLHGRGTRAQSSSA